MQCPSCSAINPDDLAFCGHCGSALPRQCPQCGLENPAGFAFCGHCRANLSHPPIAPPQAPLEGERRFVAALFADIADFTRLSEQLDAEEATALVNICLEQMTEAVVQQGGRIDKYTGEGLMAVFGAPTAHEDDLERALRAALTMRKAISGLKLDLEIPQVELHVGLACGQVVAAEVGGRGRREYTVIGTSVNLACRLHEASAPGKILVSEEMARLTQHAFLFRPLTLPYLQGWDGPVKAFELLDAQEDARPARRAGEIYSPLMGRSAELALLWRALQQLDDGKGGIVSLIGEAGVGKSRLLREVQRQMREKEMQLVWLEGGSPETAQSARYGCFRAILRQFIGMTGQPDGSTLSEQLASSLQALLPEKAGELEPYLGQILGLALPPELLQRTNGENLKWQTFRAVKEWLAALAQREATALVFEDAHWMDTTSTELLEQLLPLTERTPLLVVGVYRPEPDRPSWRLREVAGREHGEVYTELWLHPLAAKSAEQMIGHLLSTEQVPPEVLGFVMGRTEGNPLFVEEILRSMLDEGILLQADDGKWAMAPGWTEATIPDTIQGILQSRIDQLDAEPKRILQAAACIGRSFLHPLLASVAEAVGIDAARIDHHLKTLQEAALIQQEQAAPGEYSFKHVLIRDTLHRNLLRGTKSQFHAAIAQWYEKHSLQGTDPPYTLLAYHYEQTDDYDKQRHYFSEAGQQCLRGYANREASSFFTKALSLTTDPSQRFNLLLARERALDLISDRVQQRADLEELLQLIDQESNDERRSLVYNRLAYWYDSQGDYPAAFSAAEEGLAAALQASNPRAEAGSLHRIASAAWRQGRFTAALEAAGRSLEAARAANDVTQEANSLTTIGVVYRSLSDLDAARRYYYMALDIRRTTGDRKGEAISLSQLGNVFFDEGDYTRAFDHHQQALDLFQMVGDRQGEAWSRGGLGSVYLACGSYEEARHCFEEAIALRRAVSDRRGEAVAHADLGNVFIAMGELDAALTHLKKASSSLRAIGARRDEVYALTYLARAQELVGNLDAAQVAHQAALSRRREQGQLFAGIENIAGLARTALKRNHLEAARTYTEEILHRIREHGIGKIESPFLIYQTCIQILQTCDKHQSARPVLEEAHTMLLKRADRIEDPVLRRSFLERVPEHRGIIAMWQAEKVA
ncbi:MAG: tetratricopeptide repeat protein [Anaerolineae bacterium]|nr:tetratricopeptide repeat protein [Anaerolineae bacterium]